MTLIGSDQFNSIINISVHSKVKFLFKCMNSNNMLVFPLVVLHILHGIRETLKIYWLFSAFCKYMELDRAKMKLALIFRDNYNA